MIQNEHDITEKKTTKLQNEQENTEQMQSQQENTELTQGT